MRQIFIYNFKLSHLIANRIMIFIEKLQSQKIYVLYKNIHKIKLGENVVLRMKTFQG